ncbi:hypothetical protein KSS87_016475 [Heliosperma pusillum]|nr:hypothetical protein KSS87_016475 [Heliosperma pusillum]
MISDSIINVSIPIASKDFGKKKRANRSAKLKQCKLDARREQWLSQVKNKGPKEKGSSNGGGSGEFNGPLIETRKGKGKEQCCEGVEVRNESVEAVHNHDSDSEKSSGVNSPRSSVNNSGNNYAGSSGNSTSSSSSGSNVSFGSGGYCSSSTTEEEEGGGDEFGGGDGCLDDWEAVADALVGSEARWGDHCRDEETKSIMYPDSEKVKISGSGGLNSKAWRRDDAFRPQNLPNLSKQKSFPAKSERVYFHSSNPWVCKMPPSVPTSCPICCEDLDLTDSSFLPCPCGFHLCLFCHKRILEEDARCPGCRKTYTSEVAEEETVTGGSLTIRLARSCSMFSRV